MLIALGFAKFLGTALAPVTRFLFRLPGTAGFAIITGLLSGYPMGAKTTADLYKSGAVSQDEARHLFSFCNNAGPLFILGVVGVGLFNDTQVGYVLWAAHIFAALIVGILLRPGKHKIKPHQVKILDSTLTQAVPANPGKLLGDAVTNAMEAMLFVGGIIIFFSVITAAIEYTGLFCGSIFGGAISGFFEVICGVKKISEGGITGLSLGAAAFIVAFGGLSVHAQSLYFVGGTGLKFLPYIAAKILHGLIAAALTITLWTVI